MSGFFSLGGKDHTGQEQEDQDTSNSLFLFKSEEIYSKDFELWREYYQLQQRKLQQQLHHHHHQEVQDVVEFSVGPSSNNSISKRIIHGGDDDQPCLRSSGFRVMMRGGGGSGGGSVSCQDCGNQAKKDCVHLRCRSCCRSRGFQCGTHVKSTWVPAAKRRERQQQLTSLQQQYQHQQQQHQQNQETQLSLRGENPKRPRDHNPGLEVSHFPAEVNSSASFRCVRVSAIDDAEEQYAYQTAVNIGGHVFKGILYDQGPESRFSWGGEGSSGSGGVHQPLNLIAGATTTTTTTVTDANQAVTMLDPSIYPTPLSAFMAGTQFFPPPRP